MNVECYAHKLLIRAKAFPRNTFVWSQFLVLKIKRMKNKAFKQYEVLNTALTLQTSRIDFKITLNNT